MLIVTWNVNSLNPRMDHLAKLVEVHDPDVVCLQETKCSDDTFPGLEVESLGYSAVPLNGGGREGVALLARHGHDVTDIVTELAGNPRPDEARWVEATIGGVHVVSVYVVNGRTLDHPVFQDKLVMLERIADRAAELAGAPLAICGDFNIAPRDEDCWDPAGFEGSTHTSAGERERLAAILGTGLVDAWDQTPERGEHTYTWWDYRAGNFHKNKGLRIDLGLLSKDLGERLQFVGVDRDLRKNVKDRGGRALPEPAKPSDHAPLLIRFAD